VVKGTDEIVFEPVFMVGRPNCVLECSVFLHFAFIF